MTVVKQSVDISSKAYPNAAEIARATLRTAGIKHDFIGFEEGTVLVDGIQGDVAETANLLDRTINGESGKLYQVSAMEGKKGKRGKQRGMIGIRPIPSDESKQGTRIDINPSKGLDGRSGSHAKLNLERGFSDMDQLDQKNCIDPGTGQDQCSSPNLYGAQLLQALHGDKNKFLEYYHNAKQHCENPKVCKFIDKVLQNVVSNIDSLESLCKSEYPDMVLDGMEDHEEEPAPDEGDSDEGAGVPPEDVPHSKSMIASAVKSDRGWLPTIEGFADPSSKAYPSKELALTAAQSFAARFKVFAESKHPRLADGTFAPKEEEEGYESSGAEPEYPDIEGEEKEEVPEEGDRYRGWSGETEPDDRNNNGIPDELEQQGQQDQDGDGVPDEEQGGQEEQEGALSEEEQQQQAQAAEYLKQVAAVEGQDQWGQPMQQAADQYSKALEAICNKSLEDEDEDSFHKSMNRTLHDIKELSGSAHLKLRKTLGDCARFLKQLSGVSLLTKSYRAKAMQWHKDISPPGKEAHLSDGAGLIPAVESEKARMGMKGMSDGVSPTPPEFDGTGAFSQTQRPGAMPVPPAAQPNASGSGSPPMFTKDGKNSSKINHIKKALDQRDRELKALESSLQDLQSIVIGG